MAKPRKNWGLVAQFANPAALLHAAHKVREAGYTRWETWSPFPIHGMDDAQGLGGSRVPWITLIGGLTGFTIGITLQWWTGAVDYPLVIGGKPYFAWEFAVPVTFELSILLAAFGTVFGMFGLNRLPRPYHPLDKFPAFRKVTDDGFFLSIEVADPKFDVNRSRTLLEELGGETVTLVEE
ncbi:MAG: DUF3341 domain-containing protein [Myxococcales bacterium]|nr:DUF3341 domain-containing protein [Myxococcales bacterium]MCB9551564.1 DUF3341 domain-containing protein [Myxococcales bacterium]